MVQVPFQAAATTDWAKVGPALVGPDQNRTLDDVIAFTCGSPVLPTARVVVSTAVQVWGP